MGRQANAITPLLPCELGKGDIAYAPGIVAGDWVFANGVVGADLRDGFDQDLPERRLPNAGRPRHYREATALLQRAREILRCGGSELAQCVRLDQFYPHPEAVAHYQAARRELFGTYVAPSTSILERALILPEASIAVDFLALRSDAARPIEAFFPPALEVPAGAGFAPVVQAGGLVFIAGMLAAHQPGDLGGIAPEARVPAGHLWKGVAIKLEAEYVMARKIRPALEAVGLGFDAVVKAQIFLADIADIPAFNDVWDKWLGQADAVRTFIPTARPGFAIADAHIEINVVAACTGTARARIETPQFTPYANDPVAVRAGDFLFVSGLMAVDAHGVVAAAVRDPRRPWFSSPIEAQMEHITAAAASICECAGVPLGNVSRIQQFHTDLAEFHSACRVWQRVLPDTPLPISAIEVPGPLPVPGCSVQVDLWIYAPQNDGNRG